MSTATAMRATPPGASSHGRDRRSVEPPWGTGLTQAVSTVGTPALTAGSADGCPRQRHAEAAEAEPQQHRTRPDQLLDLARAQPLECRERLCVRHGATHA